MNYDCLLVDDEELLSENTRDYFNAFGVKTAWAADAASCMAFFRDHEADVILLDINLGGSSGFDLCKKLREATDIPILFISARTSDADLLQALHIGGDDYIPKPYSLTVLLAKVKAVLRRCQGGGDSIFSCGQIRVDFDNRAVYVDGQKLSLKTMEYKLLAYLVKNKNRVVPKDEIFREVWGQSMTTDNTLNVHIRHLREKIEDHPNEPRYIKTAWGTGYVFEAGGA